MPGLPCGQNRPLPRCATPDSWRSLRSARRLPVDYRDKPVPTPERGPDWMPIRGPVSMPFDTSPKRTSRFVQHLRQVAKPVLAGRWRPHIRAMQHLDLSDEEAAALVALLSRTI